MRKRTLDWQEIPLGEQQQQLILDYMIANALDPQSIPRQPGALGIKHVIKTTLQSHHAHQSQTQPRHPSWKKFPPDNGNDGLNKQGNAHNEGVKPVEPFQKNLGIHLSARQKRSVTERPVRAGQTSLHDTCGPADDNECHNGHNQVSRKLNQASPNNW